MLADEDDREPRRPAGGVAKARNLARDPLPKRKGRGLSVDQLRRHPPK
jgi:hypothetical protein